VSSLLPMKETSREVVLEVADHRERLFLPHGGLIVEDLRTHVGIAQACEPLVEVQTCHQLAVAAMGTERMHGALQAHQRGGGPCRNLRDHPRALLILLPDEIAYCLRHRQPAPFIAARFAAKEAISKAFGTGIGAQLGWQDMDIRRKESGEPFVVLNGKGKKLFDARCAKKLHVSISHTQQYAAVVAVLEG